MGIVGAFVLQDPSATDREVSRSNDHGTWPGAVENLKSVGLDEGKDGAKRARPAGDETYAPLEKEER